MGGMLGAFVLLSPVNFFRIGGPDLRRGLMEERDRALEIAEAAAEHGPDEIHRGLNVLPDDSPYRGIFRFEAHAERAEFFAETGGSGEPAATASPLSIEFEGEDEATLGKLEEGFEISDGMLRAQSARGRYLEIVLPGPIEWSDVDHVALSIRSDSEGPFMLMLAEDAESVPEPNDLKGLNPNSKFGRIEHRLIPDGQFREVQIEAGPAVESFALGRDSRIRKLLLIPSMGGADEVEIDSLRLVSRELKYAGQTHGGTSEVDEGERREAIFVRAPGTLVFSDVEIPEDQPRLRFGLGRFNENESLEVSITAGDGEERHSVFEHRLEGELGWLDFEADLSAWAGQTTDIAFESRGATNTVFWSHPVLAGRPQKRMNVIIVLEDTFRADRLDGYGGPGGLTPVKAEWARGGAVFTRGFSPSPLTRISCPSLMTSLYPTATGVRKAIDMLLPSYITLAEVLRSRGFATASFVQNPNAGAHTGLQQGFETYYDWDSIGRRADSLYGPELDAWLERNHDRNFFLYLHLLDPHFPYEPPEPFKTRANENLAKMREEEDRELLTQKGPLSLFSGRGKGQHAYAARLPFYDGEIAYNDQQFGKFLEKLEALGVLEDTLLIFVSDHGEYFGEHGGLEFHKAPSHTQVVHVPFMMSYPREMKGGREIDVPVNLVDVMPTVLDYAGIGATGVPMQGRSLAPLIRGEEREAWDRRPVFVDEVFNLSPESPPGWGSILFREWHWIHSRTFQTDSNAWLPAPILSRGYNDQRDPEQKRLWNALFVDAPVKFWLSGRLREVHEANMEIWRAFTRGEIETADYDEATLQRLRDLGYLN